MKKSTGWLYWNREGINQLYQIKEIQGIIVKMSIFAVRINRKDIQDLQSTKINGL